MSNMKMVSLIDAQHRESELENRAQSDALKNELRIEIANGVAQVMVEAIAPLKAQLNELRSDVDELKQMLVI